ncbi:MAG: BadF/BadG/BcrA/BcrD ATPase family protein [Candidatus Gottesmanbacteria bacterium]
MIIVNYFLGIDGGASKTEAIIINENGELVAEGLGGPVNYHQGGEKQMINNLQEVIDQVLVLSKLQISDIAFAVFGLAGCDSDQERSYLNNLLNTISDHGLSSRLKVFNDSEIAFISCMSREYGIVIISGTGANCFGKGKNGKTWWAGDGGWFFDQASGFATGHIALQSMILEKDGRGEKTILTNLILEQLKLSRVDELSSLVYQKQMPVKTIASLAPLVFETYKKGDSVARKIVDKIIYEMVLSISTVAKKIDLINEEFEIGLVGGVFNEELVVKLLQDKIKQILPKAILVKPKMKPAMAGALMARGSV